VAKAKGRFDAKKNEWRLNELEVFEHSKGELRNGFKIKN
jgi:hypothetical protein